MNPIGLMKNMPAENFFENSGKRIGKSIYPRKANAIFDREGIDKRPHTENISDLHSASVNLFGFILHPEDPRWRLAYQYGRLKNSIRFQREHFHNAWMADYASSKRSTKARFPSTNTHDNHLQLARALSNLEIGHQLAKKFPEVSKVGNGYRILFERTKSTAMKTDKRGVTGLPEALWQLQLYKNGNYVGRIGFNFHSEHGKKIMTIANVQGVSPEAFAVKRRKIKTEIEQAKKELGKDFGAFLIGYAKKILGNKVEYWGSKSAETNIAQYRMALRKSGVKVWK